ncbi:MAG: TrkA family potassium uptake protein [Bifidobacteriaceae bacterium]|jgi:trk system potassium uptake protein TrkA|nr:TrkA family potassium uptake protein [Bifidobacteriaceae bacterium]
MHFIVMGCGRVGAAAGMALEGRGHTVAVIDQDPAAFRRLSTGFTGQRVTGVGFDREILRQAGVAEAYGFAAVSSGDNSNVLAARVVRESFGLDNVVARIYDPDRAELYQRLGIATVATVPWAADQVLRQILPAGAAGEYQDPSGRLTLVRLDPHPDWTGADLTDIEAAAGGRVAFIGRFGQAELPGPRTVYQAGDQLHMMVPTDAMLAAERILARPPQARP